MSTVTVTPAVAGQTCTAVFWNNTINAIINQVNGNLDATNLANLAVTAAKLASSAVTTSKLDVGVVLGLTTVTAVAGDYVALSDTSDSGNAKKALVSDLFIPTVSNALSGSVIAKSYTQSQATASGSTTIPFDNTKPQNTEGDQYLTVSHTPSNASNILRITVDMCCTCSTGTAHGAIALFQDSTADALATKGIFAAEAATPETDTLVYWMTAGTTSATTFKVRAGYNTGTCYVNQGSSALFNGTLVSSITVEEFKA